MQASQITVDGQQIATELFAPDAPNGEGVLFIHGWRSNKENPKAYAQQLTTAGYTCLTFDLRGMGTSEGDIATLTRKDYLNDCLAAYDKLAELENVTSISVVGSSFGSYMACMVAARRPVKSLALRVPANYPDESFDEKQLIISDKLDAEGLAAERPSGTTYALDALHTFKGRVLIVQSEKDEIVHPKTVESFANAVPDAAQLTLHLMKGAPHSLNTSPALKEKYGTILLHWFTGTG